MTSYNFYFKIKNNLPKDVTLIVVSKMQSINEIKKIYNLGHRDFAENQVQELLNKKINLPDDICWHFVGNLQSNKIKYIVSFIKLIHSVVSYKIMYKIQIEAKKINRIISILLQFKISKEESKHGLNKEEFYDIMSLYKQGFFPNIVIQGVMGIASLTENTNQIKYEFLKLKMYFTLLKEQVSSACCISMGMSQDYKIALSCGTTMIRIGTNIFS